MNKGFLFIGAIIFAFYLYFMFYNIYLAHKKQKDNHYPNLTEKEIFKAYEESNKQKSASAENE
jgi:glycerol uptake facilitator-like aquaporin